MSHDNQINKNSWDKYQADYMRFQLLARPNYFEFLSGGGVDLDGYLIEMLGDVKGLRLLDTCCASDAVKPFSWHNLGARVTAADIAPSAIRIAQANAETMGLDVEFVEDDMQTFEKIPNEQFDIVFATYPVWLSDIEMACRTWFRILKSGGRLLWHVEHPVRTCLTEEGGALKFVKNYNEPSAAYYESFQGTPMADSFGGWSVDLPSVEHFYRISDLMNAVCNAGFRLKRVHEACDADVVDGTANLPTDIAILAVK